MNPRNARWLKLLMLGHCEIGGIAADSVDCRYHFDCSVTVALKLRFVLELRLVLVAVLTAVLALLNSFHLELHLANSAEQLDSRWKLAVQNSESDSSDE